MSSWRKYHEQTKHTPGKLRRSTHVLDWANMPDPFRHYDGVPLLDLPADPPPPSQNTLAVLHGVGSRVEAVPDGAQFLSQLLFYSASISAAKRVPATGSKYALRVNPSSGNLHPTEFHFITQNLSHWPDGLYHYRPSSHMAEQRGTGRFFLPVAGPVVFLLTSIAWREAWKYQDRAYRYCLLDIGHAAESLRQAAHAIGCETSSSGEFDDSVTAQEFGLADDEWPLLAVGIRGTPIPQLQPARLAGGVANVLSERTVEYPSIAAVHQSGMLDPQTSFLDAQPFGETVRRRRSALNFRGGSETITREQLDAIRTAANRPGLLQCYLFVHRVEGVPPGLYRDNGVLELVKPGDQRVVAAGLSLGQDLAGNACVAFSMVADLELADRSYGERGYRYAHFEAGALGQRLYLAATALGLGATGIGAFYDDAVHEYLELTPAQGQVVYHFAIGYPVADPRLGA